MPCFSYEDCTTHPTVFRPVYLLSRAKTTNHTVCVFVGVLCRCIVTFVTRKDLRATAKSKPAIAFAIMHTPATTGEFLASNDPENFLLFPSLRCLVTRGERSRPYSEEFNFRDLQYHLAMALTAWSRCTLATNCNNTGCRERGRAFSTCWNKATRKEVGDGTTI
jgi:hypothetical protein